MSSDTSLQNYKKWSVDQVSDWINGIKHGEIIAPKLKQQLIDGESLDTLNLDKLVRTYGIPGGAAEALLSAIKDLNPQSTPSIGIGLGETDILASPNELPIPHFILRDGIDEKLQNFFNFNINGYGNNQKSMNFFLYVINGSGTGKTWTGFYACNKILSQYPDKLRYRVNIDFSNGFRYSPVIDSNIRSDISLGLRVAACFLNTSFMDLYERFRLSLAQLSFQNVMEWFSKQFRKQSNNQSQIYFAIHLDEVQVNPKFTQSILHDIGAFMCSTTTISGSSKLNIIVFPILTGTSSKDLRMEVTNYASIVIDLCPFSYNESVKYLNSNIPNFNCQSQSLRFQRLVMSMGGIPRLLERLMIGIKSDIGIQYIDQLIQNTIASIQYIYKIGDWLSVCQTHKNLEMIIAMSLSGSLVQLHTPLPENNLVVEDVSRGGIIFLKFMPKYSRYYITYPLVVLELLNRNFHYSNIDLMEPLSPNWGWKKFEKFEAEFERLKNNAHVTAGWRDCTIENYYGPCPSGSDSFEFTIFEDIKLENNQFLKKDLELDALDTISLQDLFNHSYICAAGNPSVDTRVFRKPLGSDRNQLPFMFAKQLKHTQIENDPKKISCQSLKKMYQKFKKRTQALKSKYRMRFIIFTNNLVDENELERFYQNNSEAIVIHKGNLDSYLQESFSLLSVFDD